MAATASLPDSVSDRPALPWLGETGGVPAGRRAGAAADILFLAVIALLSCVPYVGGLGLYSDDWAILSVLHASQGSYPQLVAAIMPIEMATRPVQALVLAALYAAFGLDPLGYHVVNSLVLTAIVVLFYLTLRTLGFARLPALLVPLVFGLLPHYSTDRVWIAAFQANVSVCLYFLSLFADLRFVSHSDARRWLWKALGSLALVGSVLAYEVTAALLLFNVVVLAWHAGLLPPRRLTRPPVAVALGIASNIVLLAAAILYKLSTTIRADVSGGYLYRALRIAREAAPVHLGEYGIELPARLFQVLATGTDALVLLIGAIIGVLVIAYLLRTVLSPAAHREQRVNWLALVLLGAVLFILGYGMSLMTWEIGFHTTGANNRTAIAAALGVSCAFVGVLGWLSGMLPSPPARRIAMAVLIGLLAATSAVITGEVASNWVRAARQQDVVITAIQERFPAMPPGTTLLIDGVCPYVGPAPVFATSWDMTGMLQLTYGERNLRGDVLKPNSEVTPDGIRTILFDDVINVYPYSGDLWVYNLGTGEALSLISAADARQYFELTARASCPPYTDGDGAAIF